MFLIPCLKRKLPNPPFSGNTYCFPANILSYDSVIAAYPLEYLHQGIPSYLFNVQ